MFTIVGVVALCAMMWGCGGSRAPNALDESSAPTVENLRKVLRDAELCQRDPDRVMNSIRRLGSLRAVEAIPDLINLLGFRYTYPWERDGGPHGVRPSSLSRYPARDALIEIGKPALPALLEVVETREFDSIESKNARYAIGVILRYDKPTKADEFFKEAAAKASSPEAKQRLLKALETAEDAMKLSKEDL
jgi:hypothetical protein